MGRGAKTWIALAALLAALGLVACGGDEEDSGSTATEATPGLTAAEADTGGAEAGGDESGGGSDRAPSEPPGDFKPRQHEDSGGGAAQFRVKGGDNSVQEFGGEADDAQFEQATMTLHNYLDARANGYWTVACSYLSDEMTASLKESAAQAREEDLTDCPTILGRLSHPDLKGPLRREARQADAGSVRVEGNRAFVIYRGTNGAVLVMPMTKGEGRWKVASLAPVPLN